MKRKVYKMIIIKGTYNTAECFATTVDDNAIEQIREVCNTEAYRDCKIRIMPDVHAGKGCTIGTTMTVKDKVSPSMVGVDIGCGMYTVYLGNVDIDLQKVDEAAHYIPSGFNVWESRQEHFDLTELRCFRDLTDSRRLERSLGTLGGGNHFIEIDVDDDGGKYLVCASVCFFDNGIARFFCGFERLSNEKLFGRCIAEAFMGFRKLLLELDIFAVELRVVFHDAVDVFIHLCGVIAADGSCELSFGKFAWCDLCHENLRFA